MARKKNKFTFIAAVCLIAALSAPITAKAAQDVPLRPGVNGAVELPDTENNEGDGADNPPSDAQDETGDSDTSAETRAVKKAKKISSEDAEQASGESDGEAVNDGTPKGILNSAKLAPKAAASGDLNGLAQAVMDEILTDEMSTYEKVTACYDYLLENMSYGSQMRYLNVSAGDTTCSSIYYTYGEVEGFASVAFTSNVGMCNGYASAFIVMANAIGLDAHLVEGSTASARGGYAYHKWAEVDIGDETYIFDPQLDQDLSKAGLPAYSVFCKTYDQVPGRYIRKARNT